MSKNANLQIFVVVVDRRDADLFSSLENNRYGRELVWGLQKKDFDVWKKINCGDIICMVLEDTVMVTLCGRINKTNVDPGLPKKWGRDIRTLQMTHVVYFTKLQKLPELFRSVQKHIIKNNINLPGLYKILEGHTMTEPSRRQASAGSGIQPIDLAGPPAKVKYEVVRFIRDTQKSRLLKEIYKNQCQMCGYRLEIGTNVYYSEVHHIRPLNEGGDDDLSNMIVLCPTHHAEFDYGVICIDKNLTWVINKNFKKVGVLTVARDHVINIDNIKHNLKRVRA